MSEPRWLELICRVVADRADELVTRLTLLGHDQCWLEQPLHHRPIDDGWSAEPRDPEHCSIHVCVPLDSAPGRPDEVAAELHAALGGLAEHVLAREVASQDWLEAWRRRCPVVPLAGGWTVAPPWLAEQVTDRARCVVIDPGMAFGTGDHPTTRDSAILLLEMLRPGDRVLDLGAGSGVLSILAIRAGAATATAVELDPLATLEIPRNAGLNQVAGIEVVAGEAATVALAAPYDLLLLNIGARQARQLRPRCAELAAVEGRLVLSGLAEWAAAAVLDEYLADGWAEVARRQGEGGWVTVALARPKPG